MPEDIFPVLKDKAQQAKENLARVIRNPCKVHAIKKNELVFVCPEENGLRYRLTVSPGLQEGTFSLSTGPADSDTDKFLQRDLTYDALPALMMSPMIWGWTYKSFNNRFSQVLNGLIRLSYENREAWPILRPLIEKALSK